MIPLTPTSIRVVAVLAILAGAVVFAVWVPVALDLNAPIVEGTVVSSEPITPYGMKRAAVSIELKESETIVQAHVPRSLVEKLPETVKFHYSGSPSKEVFLYEHEENPLWIALIFWASGCALFFFARNWRWISPDQDKTL